MKELQVSDVWVRTDDDPIFERGIAVFNDGGMVLVDIHEGNHLGGGGRATVSMTATQATSLCRALLVTALMMEGGEEA